MFSYMIGLNNAESFHVAYSNYETVWKLKNVETRLSQQTVRNDSLFVIIRGAEVIKLWFGTFWKQIEVKPSLIRPAAIT